MHPAGPPPVLVSGIDSAQTPGVIARFTGPRMDLAVTSETPVPGVANATGPLHMVVTLPESRVGRSEPLVATGHRGAGDLVCIEYADAGHVRIVLDHWGRWGARSGLIPVDYGIPHEIWISMDSLDASPAQGPGRPVTVILDGEIALSAAIAPYPSSPAEVTVMQNRINGSNSDPAFTGTVHLVERLGAASIPMPRS